MRARLAAIWRQLLKVSTVAPADNFFDLGGHSLLLLRLSNEIRREFRCEVPLRRLFDAPTLGAIAALVEENTRAPVLADGAGPVPLKRESDDRALYLICPAAGSAAGYIGLAAELEAFGSVWGLEAPGLSRGEKPIGCGFPMIDVFGCNQVKEKRAQVSAV